MPTAVDTCRTDVLARLRAAGWGDDPHSVAEQRSITDGRIVSARNGFVRQPPKRVDYLLRYTRDFPLAVVEANAAFESAWDGLPQAKQYAEMLGLMFAFATDGRDIIEFDSFTGRETLSSAYPTPAALWERYAVGRHLTAQASGPLLTPLNHAVHQGERYYQAIAVNWTLEAILQGRRRLLLTMAAGAGKTAVAFQLSWKLWNARWNRTGDYLRPRILYLANRHILVDGPKESISSAFVDALHRPESAEAGRNRETYFAIHQALVEHAGRVCQAFPRDFFDLVIVDECHRGSAREDSAWRAILDYFDPAYKLGMMATPLRDETRDASDFFGDPLYTYTLRQGIDDGFLAPFCVHRVNVEWAVPGWRPTRADLEKYGRTLPDGDYAAEDLERIVALRARTNEIARHLTAFLKKSDRFAKTIVFCVDPEHAGDMCRALSKANDDLTVQAPDYVCRVTADDGAVGRDHLNRFQDVELTVPTILTTSELLASGVDAPMCTNIVLARMITSMTEFKHIVGCGTRIRDEYGKLQFNVIDYTGSATLSYEDPAFDGEPARVTVGGWDAEDQHPADGEPETVDASAPGRNNGASADLEHRTFSFDGGTVHIVGPLVYESDANGTPVRQIRYTDYAAEGVRALCRTASDLRTQWTDPTERPAIIQRLADRGINFAALADATGQDGADPLDMLCHLAFNAPLRTRRERAQQLRDARPDLFVDFGAGARQIIEDLLDTYVECGAVDFGLPDVLQMSPISAPGPAEEIVRSFGGPEQLRNALIELQTYLYSA
jgi:type I restriction enzyme R subunit